MNVKVRVFHFPTVRGGVLLLVKVFELPMTEIYKFVAVPGTTVTASVQAVLG